MLETVNIWSGMTAVKSDWSGLRNVTVPMISCILAVSGAGVGPGIVGMSRAISPPGSIKLWNGGREVGLTVDCSSFRELRL